MPVSLDTIAAVATPPGVGGIGIVRVSGPLVSEIARSVLGVLPRPRRAEYHRFVDRESAALDEGIALYFPAPGSFTGEDVLELQGHGGPVVLDLLVQRVCELGARPAMPGEFSERAFLNGKLDLAQAEAVADLIEAGSEVGARAALRSLQGELSARIHALEAALVELRTNVEAALDFPDEDIDFLSDERIGLRLEELLGQLTDTSGAARQGQLLREGMTVVIAGRPNAGKSSLLNALAGREAAIVTHVPGTTRDILREYLHLDGMPLHVVDTAGLRESDDPVEQEGIRRAWSEIERADRLLLVIDDQIGSTDEDAAILARLPASLPRTVVRNKCDLSGRASGPVATDQPETFAISALEGWGLDALRDHLEACMGYRPAGEGDFMARRRHLQALEAAREQIVHALAAFHSDRGGELIAEDLRLAHRRLGEITGEFTSEDLLGAIFASFCIGK
jgi:tRNA modification GTPase